MCKEQHDNKWCPP